MDRRGRAPSPSRVFDEKSRSCSLSPNHIDIDLFPRHLPFHFHFPLPTARHILRGASLLPKDALEQCSNGRLGELPRLIAPLSLPFPQPLLLSQRKGSPFSPASMLGEHHLGLIEPTENLDVCWEGLALEGRKEELARSLMTRSSPPPSLPSSTSELDADPLSSPSLSTRNFSVTSTLLLSIQRTRSTLRTLSSFLRKRPQPNLLPLWNPR